MKLTISALVVLAVGVFIGCESIDRTVYDAQVSPVTNSATGEIMLRTNLTVKPAVQTGVDVIGMVPTPYTTIASTAAGLILAGYAAWRNSRNKKTAKAVIAGAEEYKKTLNAADAKEFTKILASNQERSGVRPEAMTILAKIRNN